MTSRVITPARGAVCQALMWLVIATLAGCSFEPEEKVWEISGPAFGTEYHISVVLTEDQERLENLSQGITDILESVDASMSTWREDSELSRFNQAPDQSLWFPVSDSLYAVLATARAVSGLSNGAFDVTVGPVVNLWGFGPDARPETVPDDETLALALASTGYEKLELREEPRAIRARSRQYVDLSAIAKGYAVDVVATYLENEGVEAFLVEIGGEIRTAGRKPGGDLWRLAVEEPVSGQRQVNRVVALEEGAMATSGDYRNYYESQGQRYSHTIDPETGKPVTHNLASVTVIAPTAMEADAWATTFSVMGFEKSRELASERDMAAYFIVRKEDGFESEVTSAFSSYLID